MAKSYERTLINVWVRHWKLVALVTLSCVLLAGLINHLLPHRYQSEMKFLVNTERADLVITSGENQSPAPPSEVSETQVNSEIELMRSRDILEKIVIDQQLYLPFLRSSGGALPSKSVGRATDKLAKDLSVSALRRTNIIDVTYRASSPELSVEVLRDIGEQYLVAHLLAHSAPGTEEFFQTQVDHFRKDLVSARTALAGFHRETQLYAMPEQQAALLERLQTVSSQLNDVTAQIRVQDSRLAESDRQLTVVPERIVTQVRQSSDQLALQQIEPMLAQLENRRIELSTKFKPTDRLIRELDDQIANTHRQIDHIRQDRSDEKTSDLNALHQSLKSDATKSRIDLRGLQTQHTELERMHQNLLKELDGLDNSFVKQQELERVEKEAEDNLALYTHRLDEARLAQALDHDQFSNVVMIEKPVESSVAVSPNLPLNLLAGFLVGLLLSAGLALFAEERKGRLFPIDTPLGQRSSDLVENPFQVASGD